MLSHFSRVLGRLSHSRICHNTRRPYTSIPISTSSAKNRIILLDSVDPYWNLAYETFLLEQKRKQEDGGRWLLLWRNEPSVILGRNQNPWVECDIPWLRKQNIKLVRRESGGGTVYHDLGNTCISIISEKHEPELNLKYACEVLKDSFNLDAYIGPRKDIFLDGHKVSGSAFRITSKASYHHFTLLLSTDLSQLTSALQPTHSDLISRATASVRSNVLNLSARTPTIDHSSLTAALASHFNSYYGMATNAPGKVERIDLPMIMSIPEVQKLHQQNISWDYVFGRTPEFTHTLKYSNPTSSVKLSLVVDRGMITNVTVETSSPADEFVLENALRLGLLGYPYHAETLSQTLQAQEILLVDQPTLDRFLELRRWLESSIHS